MDQRTDPLARQLALSALTTEQFNLQSARLGTIAEANGRSTLYLGTLSSAVIAIAFVGQASQLGNAFYLLLRGRCVAFHRHTDGREVAYPELREGDVFGEISLILDKPVTATVRAQQQCVVLRLDRAAFDKHILSQPGMRGALMRVGTERLQRTAKLLAGARDWNEGDLRV